MFCALDDSQNNLFLPEILEPATIGLGAMRWYAADLLRRVMYFSVPITMYHILQSYCLLKTITAMHTMTEKLTKEVPNDWARIDEEFPVYIYIETII